MYQSRIRATKKRGSDKRRELIEPEDGQEYGIAQEMMGNGRIRIYCMDKEVRMGRIRGSMRKYSGKVIIEKGDLVLFAGRDYGDMVDVFHKYNHDEVADLMKYKLLPDTLMSMMHADFDDAHQVKGKDDYVLFMEDDSVADGAALEVEASGSSEEIDIDAI